MFDWVMNSRCGSHTGPGCVRLKMSGLSAKQRRGDDVWLTRRHGIAPTAWLYFVEIGGLFISAAACRI